MGNVTPQIIGLGASTPVGRNAWSSAAAVRAGICGFCEHPFMIDTAGEPMRIARAPWLDVAVQGPERYLALLIPAMEEAFAPLRERIKSSQFKMGFTLGLPSPRPGLPDGLGQTLIDAMAFRFQEPAHKQTFNVGHAAGYLAMNKASEMCERGILDLCLVAAVDSYLEPETLEWLEANDQIHGAGPQNNAWGFIPGEAAGAVLVARPDIATRLRCVVFGEVVSVGIGQETKLIKTDSVCIGEGLTQAFRTALKALATEYQIHNVFCDLNGETYRADEYGLTALRTKERFRAATEFVAPADCWGDVGAASAPLHMILGLVCHRKRYGAGPLSMVWASSESGKRGAAVIRSAEAGSQ